MFSCEAYFQCGGMTDITAVLRGYIVLQKHHVNMLHLTVVSVGDFQQFFLVFFSAKSMQYNLDVFIVTILS